MPQRLFSNNHIGLYQQNFANDMYKRVMRMGEAELKDAETGALAKSVRLEELKLDWDSLASLGHHEKRSTVYNAMFDERQEVVEVVYSFELSYGGSRALLYLQPSTSNQLRFEPTVNDHTIQFEIVGADKAQLERIKEFMNQNVSALNSELGVFNQTVESAITRAITDRKEQLRKNDEGLAAFGVPLKQK